MDANEAAVGPNNLTAHLRTSNASRIPDLMGKVDRWRVIEGEAGTLEVICTRVSEGESLADIARAWNVPKGLMGRWLAESPERMQAYKGALSLWGDEKAQECIGLADGADTEGGAGIAHAKLQIDTRLKLAAKWNQEMYGDKVTQVNVGSVNQIDVSLGEGALALLKQIREIAVKQPETVILENDAT